MGGIEKPVGETPKLKTNKKFWEKNQERAKEQPFIKRMPMSKAHKKRDVILNILQYGHSTAESFTTKIHVFRACNEEGQ